MDALTLWILAASGVITILLFTVRGLLEQLPELFAAWHRAKKALRDQESRGE
ncbi:hypothetical protein [Streptomyces sp. NPDC046909]|uniref:hypothetical protein n=1 Tax=Streptomyces sp. NPDC046909 TaxID=3155617 RepID=UPI00340E087D